MQTEARAENVHYRAELRPHRSLPPRAFFILMLVVSATSFITGIIFLCLGAWPIMGFFGIDVLALYFAFRANYRSAKMREILELAADNFTVERVSIRGERRFWRFQPFWLRVTLLETGHESNRLLLSSHGKSLAIAGFLNAEERRGLAADIRKALALYKAPPQFAD